MAGYTSRFFLGLTISSVFGFLSVWFLKRKNPRSASKAIQVEEEDTADEYFENHFLTTLISPMKLKNNQEDSCCQEESASSAEMQLKEAQQQVTNPNANSNGVPLTNGKSKISKSKMREKNCTLPKDYITNGDRDTSEEDNGIDLSNGIEAIDLNTTTKHVPSAKDELLLMNAINKTHTDMEISNGTNSSSHIHQVNGEAETVDIPSVQQNGGSAKEQCDTEERNSKEEHANGQTDLPPSVQIDSCGPLTLPVVCAHTNGDMVCAETNGDMLESPGATYCDSVVVDALVHETVSYRDIVVAQKATSETQSSDDTESVVSEIGSDESVNETVQENGDATVQKVEVIAIVPSSQDIPNAESDSAEKSNAECVNVSNQISPKPPEQKVTYARVCASSLKKSAPQTIVANNRLQGAAECANVQSGQSQIKGTNNQENQSVPINLENNRIQGAAAECATVSGQSQAGEIGCQQNSVPQSVENAESLNVPNQQPQVSASTGLLGSYDSGKGGSEILYDGVKERFEEVMSYEFEILQELVGLLIGKGGRYVRYIIEESKANILIKRHPMCDLKKICAVTGTTEAVHCALKMIRKRFPVEHYPTVTLSQICLVPQETPQADILKLNLPEGVQFDVMLCATVNAGHFFLQQPTHPSFHSLPSLNAHMTAAYNEDVNAPPLPHLDRGFICAAKVHVAWYRAEIDEVFDDTDECRVKFLDFGGYTILPRTSLKQIRFDFMSVPFQAAECYLGDVTYPEGETDWSDEATAAFQQISQGQILQGYICGYAENRIPYVRLFKITGANLININAEMVNLGFAKSLLPPPPSPEEV